MIWESYDTTTDSLSNHRSVFKLQGSNDYAITALARFNFNNGGNPPEV
jgi:hypothetical protein